MSTFWRTLSPLTRVLVVFAAINPVLVTILLLFSTPRGTFLQYLAQFLLAGPKDFDSWEPMIRALDYLRTEQSRTVYEEIFFSQRIKFQYPLTSLLFLYPLEAAQGMLARFGLSLTMVLDAVSWAAVVVTVYGSIRIFGLECLRSGGDRTKPHSPSDAFIRYLTLVALGLTFYPLLKGYSLRQVQTWVTALFTLMLWAWMTRREVTAGILGGAMILLKPQYALLLPWALLARRGRFAAACAVLAAAGAVMSVLLFGWENNLDYRRVLLFMARHGESYYANQSLNGLANRFLGNGFNLRFDTYGFAPFHENVYVISTITTMAFSVMALATARMKPTTPWAEGLAFVVMSATLASPIAWEHHYGVLLPMAAFLAARFWDGVDRRRAALLVLAVCYIFASNYFGVARRFARAGPWWTLLQSYLLAAGLVVWGLLLREIFRRRHVAAS